MKTPVLLRTLLPKSPLKFQGGWMAVVLLSSILFFAKPAGSVLAAACVSAQDGNWNEIATWDCGAVPTSADDVTILHNVVITTDQSVNSVVVGADEPNNLFGVLTFSGEFTLTLTGNFSVDPLGLFSPTIIDPDTGDTTGGGSVVFGAGSQAILGNGVMVEFWNLSKTASASDETLSFDASGVRVLNNLVLQGTAPSTNLLLRSTTLGTQWAFDPQGVITVDYVDVQDSNNISAGTPTIIVANGVDSLNNTGWAFESASVSLVSDVNPAAEYTYVTFTATVTNYGTPPGTVAFQSNGQDISDCGDQPLVAGVATCKTDDLETGSHAITALYSGDAVRGQATSNTVTQVINQLVLVSLSSWINPSAYQATVTFDAIISPAKQGAVTFSDNDVIIPGCDSVAVNKGKASCETAILEPGSHEIEAEFVEAVTLRTEHSNTLVQWVKVQSNVVIVGSPNPSDYGKSITFTATVISPANANGTMTFLKGNVNIPNCINVPLDDGVAECTVNDLAVGTHNISVVYSGDQTTFGFIPSAVAQLVNWLKNFLVLVFK